MNLNPLTWTAEFWAVLVALVALFRPDVARLRQRRANRIVVTVRQPIEVGYAALGPTVGIIYSLITFGVDRAFVEVRAKCRRKADGATHVYTAAVGRPLQAFVDPAQSASQSVLWTPIFARNETTVSANTLFTDPATQRAVQNEIAVYQSEWFAYLREVPEEQSLPFSDEARKHYDEFLRKPLATEFWRRNRDRVVMFWRAGDYELTLEFVRPDGVVEGSHLISFSVSDDDQRRLEFNAGIMQDIAAGNVKQNLAYHFVLAEPKLG